MDTFTCGSCSSAFTDLEAFLSHKQICVCTTTEAPCTKSTDTSHSIDSAVLTNIEPNTDDDKSNACTETIIPVAIISSSSNLVVADDDDVNDDTNPTDVAVGDDTNPTDVATNPSADIADGDTNPTGTTVDNTNPMDNVTVDGLDPAAVSDESRNETQGKPQVFVESVKGRFTIQA